MRAYDRIRDREALRRRRRDGFILGRPSQAQAAANPLEAIFEGQHSSSSSSFADSFVIDRPEPAELAREPDSIEDSIQRINRLRGEIQNVGNQIREAEAEVRADDDPNNIVQISID